MAELVFGALEGSLRGRHGRRRARCGTRQGRGMEARAGRPVQAAVCRAGGSRRERDRRGREKDVPQGARREADRDRDRDRRRLGRGGEELSHDLVGLELSGAAAQVEAARAVVAAFALAAGARPL